MAENFLIIVDLQKGFITPHSRHVVHSIEMIQHKFDHVVYTKFWNPDPSPFRTILDYHKLPKGHEDTVLALQPRTDALILERPLYTCVTRELKDILKERNIKQVYLCGIATEACILKTAMDLFEDNIQCLLIKDLCASDAGVEYHDMAIILLEKLIGPHNVLEAGGVLERLQSEAA